MYCIPFVALTLVSEAEITRAAPSQRPLFKEAFIGYRMSKGEFKTANLFLSGLSRFHGAYFD